MKKRLFPILMAAFILLFAIQVSAVELNEETPDIQPGTEETEVETPEEQIPVPEPGADDSQIELGKVVPMEDFYYRIMDDYVRITAINVKEPYDTVVIPETIEGYPVTEICGSAMRDQENLVSVVIPDSVTKMWPYVFGGDHNLKYVKLPEGITSLPSYIFENCTSLVSVKLPEHIRMIESFAFAGCTALEDVNIPDSVVSIQDSAFMDCTSLEEIDLPEGLKTIGMDCFFRCNSLREVVVPSTVTIIHSSAFGYQEYFEPKEDFVLYIYPCSSGAVRYVRDNPEIIFAMLRFFDDDEKGAWTWAGDYIYDCVMNSIVTGYPDNTFQPDRSITRIELVTILYKIFQQIAMDLPLFEFEHHPFQDATGAWYQDQLDMAYTCGIVTGTSATTFSPDATVTRQDMATILYRFITTFYEVDANQDNLIADYSDGKQIAPYAREAVEFCLENGIMNGVGNGTFDPLGSASRAMAATVIDRAFIGE